MTLQIHPSTLTRYYPEFVQLLKRGGCLRFLASDATPEVLAMQVFRSSSVKDADVMISTLRNNVASIKTIAAKAPNNQDLHLRIMQYLAPYSMAIIEDYDGTSMTYVKILAFQTPDAEQLTFIAHSREDSVWFQFFADQFERMWEAGKPVDVFNP